MTRIRMTMVLVLIPSVLQGQGTVSGAREPTVFVAESSVLNLMSAAQFSAAGLSKLLPAELRELSNWVRTHSLMTAELARTAALNPEAAPSSNPGMMETRMEGDFTGWDGRTVFQFANGQVWQQISFGTVYQFARSPKVTLVATSGGWRMQVAGVPQSIQVRRIR